VQRRTPFFIYLILIVSLTVSLGYLGWVRTWSLIYVPTMYPPFADMRVIQGAVASVEHGYNPRISNPGDLWRRPLNYPMLWVTIGKALNFSDESRFIMICTTLVLCFAGVCASLILRFPSFELLASLVSTATLLGVERANIDLLIFCLLFPAAVWLPKLWSPIPLLLGTLLKLYPVFALGALFIQRQYRLFAASLVATVAIFVSLWDQLAAIRLTTPTSCLISYGIPSVGACVEAFRLPFWQLAGTLAAIGAATLGLSYYFSKSDAVRPLQGTAFNLILVGASIYVGTFIFSANFDYRLIFLIFCIPFLQTRPFPLARMLIFVVLLAMNELLITHWLKLSGLILVVFAKIAIFVVLSAYLVALAWTAIGSLYARPKVGAAVGAQN